MIDEPKQSNFTELVKVGNPYKNNSFSRLYYFTQVEFEILNRNIELPMKVDTGSAYTVIGLKNNALIDYIDIIKQSKLVTRALDASGDKLKLFGFVINNFKLTNDIIIPRLKIYFSEDIEDRALLGMDILSLFETVYRLDTGSTNGRYWIYNYKQSVLRLKNRMLNKELDYIDPDLIDSIDEINDKPVENKTKYTMQDASAAYANKIGKKYLEEKLRGNNSSDASPKLF